MIFSDRKPFPFDSGILPLFYLKTINLVLITIIISNQNSMTVMYNMYGLTGKTKKSEFCTSLDNSVVKNNHL